MPDHMDPASSEDAADNVVSLPADSPFGTMEKILGSQDGENAGGRRSKRFAVAVLWTVAIVIVVVDQITKQWALSALADGRHTALLGQALGLVLVRNPGAAFSFATGQTWIFALIALLVVIIIIRVSRNLVSRSWAVALGLVLGGAVGNLIDRLLREPGFLRGHVIDFIDYGGYFVGNIADIAIVLAAVGIIILSLGGWEIDGTRAGAGDATEPGGSKTSVRKTGGARRLRRHGDARPSGDSETSEASAPVEPTEPQ
ncbi:signal peptidase II [Actinomyces sp. ZJ308]|uniref:signal peptidase II n=1 Tax=Actinomyces sp. ZJ308 TaxID=2708342 RepID=UPI00141DDBC9|nr:signal peptidase II [Actinomyces sp. ZJ308]